MHVCTSRHFAPGDMFLRGFDDDIRDHLANEMKEMGIDVQFNTNPAKVCFARRCTARSCTALQCSALHCRLQLRWWCSSRGACGVPRGPPFGQHSTGQTTSVHYFGEPEALEPQFTLWFWFGPNAPRGCSRNVSANQIVCCGTAHGGLSWCLLPLCG